MWCPGLNTSSGTIHTPECSIDAVHVGWIVVFVAVTFPAVICIQRRYSKHLTKSRYWVQYTGHSTIWLLSLCLMTVDLTAITEGLLTQFYHCSSVTLQLYFPRFVDIIGICTSLYLYNFIETYNKLRWLSLCVVYWGLESLISTLRLWALVEPQLSRHSMKMYIAAVNMTFSDILFAVGLVTLCYEIWLKMKGKRTRPAEELDDLTYVHPHVNVLSRLTWQWVSSLLIKGYKDPLTLTDLGSVPEAEYSKRNYETLKAIFVNEKEQAKYEKREPSLLRCFVKAFWRDLIIAGVLKLTADQIIYIPPICLDYMVKFVSSETANSSLHASLDVQNASDLHLISVEEFFTNGYVMVLVSFLVCLLYAFCFQYNIYLAQCQGIRCKGALQAMVFDKTLHLSTSGLSEGQLTTGQVMNHMSVDPLNIFYLFYVGHSVWSMPLQVLTGAVLLYVQLGRVALISSLLIIVMVPVQYFIGRKLGSVQKRAIEQADERLKQSHEMLGSIKFIKLCAWEFVFSRAVHETRRAELVLLFKASCCRVLSILVTDGTPVISALLTFVLYPIIEKQPLQPGKAFSALALFNILTQPLFLITLVMNTTSHAAVSMKRLTKFLLVDEVEAPLLTTVLDCPEGRVRKQEPQVVMEASQHETSPQDPLLCSQQVSMLPLKPRPGGLVTGADKLGCEAKANGNTKCPSLEFPCQGDDDCLVHLENASFSWDCKKQHCSLSDISLHIPRGKLTMVVGGVGSGKSSLLSALLGEMYTLSGSVHWSRSTQIAYVAQKAWLMNASLQDNILFGCEMDSEKYNAVLDACCLRPDLDMLPAGDLTEIGEKGINLSGGQKQRVSLGRALYHDVDLILMDDPLSALDAHVGKAMFEQAIMSKVVAQQQVTIVLVSHHVQYLRSADWVVMMSDGGITKQGTYDQVKDDITHNIKTTAPDHHPKCELQKEDKLEVPVIGNELPVHVIGEARVGSAPSMNSVSGPALYDETLPSNKDPGDVSGDLIEEEEIQRGSVSWKYYLYYARAAGCALFMLPVLLYFLRQVLRMVGDFYLSTWIELMVEIDFLSLNTSIFTNSQMSALEEHLESLNGDQAFYMWLYVGIEIMAVVTVFLCILTLEVTMLYAAKRIHNHMLTSILRAPMRFFDTTPLGRIMNRLTGDTNVIDEKLVVTLDQMLFYVLYVLGGIVVNMVSTPIFILTTIPMLAGFLIIQRFYIASSRELQRLDNITRSPVLSHFSETLAGLSTIRAYRAQGRFRERNQKHIDVNNTAFLYLHTANSWMGIRLDCLGSCVVLASGMCSVTVGLMGLISPSLVGLGMAYAIVTSSCLTWTMRVMSEIEMLFNSVERVHHYSNLPSEADPLHELEPPATWPSKGSIEFDQVSVSYAADLEPVLSDITMSIGHGAKVGVCGRTGSGKSSLMLSLFRLVHAVSGRILIDGIDISKVPLQKLRGQLSIIPQDPVLFAGTIRSNLDPLMCKSDRELWHALDIAQLKGLITSLPQQLDTQVTEGGENLSVGQRQLFCLARAFLRNSCIVVMDEATSSIDAATDQAIQTVVQTAFSGKTVITVAHRLNTIMQSDIILVLKDGRILEQGSPKDLLQRQESVFNDMVKQNQF